MKKRLLSVLMIICVFLAMVPGMAFAEEMDIAPAPAKSDDIVILATSDVHCGVDAKIGYAGVAAYKKQMEAAYNNVALVDIGDAVQGESIGTISKGEYIIDILNEMGYTALIPGNHEFDYGMDQFLNVLAKNTKTPYISCNFRTIADDKAVFDPYIIKTYGDKKVAFIGICTPETLVKSTPTYFQDEKGNWKYDFCNDSTGKALYDKVQKTIDAAKAEGADYIVALGHLGNDEADTAYWKSSDVIKNTKGLDAFIDGHDHQVKVLEVKDAAGKAVTLLGTGTKIENIGKLVIAKDGKITAENVTGLTEKDEAIDKFVKDIQAKYAELVNKVVAKTEVQLTTKRADGSRAVRSEETNLGDLCADAYLAVSGADVAFVNGGGVRADIAKGDVTFDQIIAVHPFGNALCVCEATGQDILDALELGSKSVGSGESGGFLQVAGLTYSINPYIETPVVLDEAGLLVDIQGPRKVSDVKIAGEPLDPEKTYTVSSHNYMLKNAGDGYTMFKDNKFLQEDVMLDNQVLITYITEKLGGKVGEEYAEPQGRIKVLTAAEAVKAAEETKAAAQAEVKELKEKNKVLRYVCKPTISVSKTHIATIKWNASTVSDVKYQVWMSTKSSSGYKRMITTTKTYYKAKSLKAGKKYYFKVRAIKKIGDSYYKGNWSVIKNAVA